MVFDATPLLLIIEDNDEDYQTTLRVLQKSSHTRRIERCSHGDDALDFIHARYQYSNRQQPSVILLDLNLPGTDGREVLYEIKNHPSLKSIPVVILSTSSNPIDIETSYQNGANGYMIKPVNFAAFEYAMKCFDDYWFSVVALPGASSER